MILEEIQSSEQERKKAGLLKSRVDLYRERKGEGEKDWKEERKKCKGKMEKEERGIKLVEHYMQCEIWDKEEN